MDDAAIILHMLAAVYTDHTQAPLYILHHKILFSMVKIGTGLVLHAEDKI